MTEVIIQIYSFQIWYISYAFQIAFQNGYLTISNYQLWFSSMYSNLSFQVCFQHLFIKWCWYFKSIENRIRDCMLFNFSWRWQFLVWISSLAWKLLMISWCFKLYFRKNCSHCYFCLNAMNFDFVGPHAQSVDDPTNTGSINANVNF